MTFYQPNSEVHSTGQEPVEYDGAVALGAGQEVTIIVHIDDVDSPAWVGMQRAGDEPIAAESFGDATDVRLCEDEDALRGAVARATLEQMDDKRVRLIGRETFRR
jgi:hypothetical protein